MIITPSLRESKQEIVNHFERRCTQTPNVEVVMIGDSIVSNFEKHCMHIWKQYFPSNSMLLGIPGDMIEHVWYRVLYRGIPKNAKNIIIHVGTNNLQYCSVNKIVCAISSLYDAVSRCNKGTRFIISAILPRREERQNKKWNQKIQSINDLLQIHFSGKCHFVVHECHKFTKSHFYRDGLHLSEEGYEEFSKSFAKFSLKNPSHSSPFKCSPTIYDFQYQNGDFPALEKDQIDIHPSPSDVSSEPTSMLHPSSSSPALPPEFPSSVDPSPSETPIFVPSTLRSRVCRFDSLIFSKYINSFSTPHATSQSFRTIMTHPTGISSSSTSLPQITSQAPPTMSLLPPPPLDTTSVKSPLYEKEWLARKKKNIGKRKRAPWKMPPLLPPTEVEVLPEYEPWEPRRNNRGRRRAPKTPDSSDTECMLNSEPCV